LVSVGPSGDYPEPDRSGHVTHAQMKPNPLTASVGRSLINLPMHWLPRFQLPGIGLAIVSTIAATLGIPIPLSVRWLTLFVGLLMCAAPVIEAGYVQANRTRSMVPFIGMIISALCFFGFAWYFFQFSGPHTLPITIAELKPPAWNRFSGLQSEKGDLDPPVIGVGDVYIYNISLSRALTLRIFLIIKDKSGRVTKIEGDGRSVFRVVGQDDDFTKYSKERNIVPTDYVLSPVSLPPQTTRHGIIPFIITQFGFGGDIDKHILEYYAGGMLNRQFTYELELKDVVSDTTITVPVPSSGYRGEPEPVR
jgi:hypothetical protein